MEQVVEEKIVRKIIPSVKPYLDGKSENMGLSKYGEVVIPGSFWEESLTCLEQNGQKRYLSGLDEYAPEVQKISDPEKKAAVIKNIREKVIFLEKTLGANQVDIKDPEFWNKVKTVHPKNHDFWSTVSLRTGNEPVFLDPEDPNDLVKLCGIEAGGFSGVAKSFDDARFAPVSPKWFLDREKDTAISRNELRKIKNKAKGTLESLMEKDSKKMFYLAKNLDNKPFAYTLSTSNEVIYAFLDDFIEGKGVENAKKASVRFNQFASMKIAELKIRAVIADAGFYKMILRKSDGKLYHTKTDRMLGDNIEEVVEFLNNPLNANTWQALLEEVEARWKL